MSIRYLLDENMDPRYKAQLLRRQPHLVVWSVGDPGSPPKGTLDPDILHWRRDANFILVTNNRRSMPAHLTDHLASGQHMPGIIALNEAMSIGQTIDELVLIALASDESEYRDQIAYLPLA